MRIIRLMTFMHINLKGYITFTLISPQKYIRIDFKEVILLSHIEYIKDINAGCPD